MKNRELKSLKIVFKNPNNGKILSVSDFEELIKTSDNTSLKNFFRGCKHIVERHYTEAIKWFQLADSFEESILLILFCSIKVKDSFLYSEYEKENFKEFTIFQSYNFYPFVVNGGTEQRLDLKKLKQLKEKFLGD